MVMAREEKKNDNGNGHKREVVSAGGSASELMGEMQKHAGKGVSTKSEDSLVPLVYVLDSKSPQCDERSGQYIPGAKGGHIWLRNYAVVDGQTGIKFQPCSDIWVDWVEWVPRERGGGFVGRHPTRPEDAIEAPHPENPNKKRWMRQNGNEVRETRNVAGYVITSRGDLPFVIPFSSTGHTVAKGWNFTMMTHKLPNGDIEPSFARRYLLKTRQRTNTQGKWYVFDISEDEVQVKDDSGKIVKDEEGNAVLSSYVTLEQFKRGADLYEAFKTGAKRAEEEVAVAGAEDDDAM
jgi:hypothetical protein